MVVIHSGRIVVEWGDTDKVTDSHSVRKSILSVLIGIAIQKGLMDLDKTLEELGIDDKNPRLTPEERSATVEDLLRSSSGIYHAYVGDREDNPPAPASHSLSARPIEYPVSCSKTAPSVLKSQLL